MIQFNIQYKMLAMEQCLTQITQLAPHLYLSAISAISDSNLDKNGITLVINATKELPMFPPRSPSIISVRVPVYDSCEERLYPFFQVRMPNKVVDKIR